MAHTMFTKTQIDLLLRSARSRQPDAEASEPSQQAEPFDFRVPRHLSSGQIEKLLGLHADFVNRLGRSLTALTGSECKAVPLSVEQMAYSDFIGQFPEAALYQVLRIEESEGKVFIQVDLPTVLALIDLTLGGDGKAVETSRPLTAVEQEIFEPILEMVGAELRTVWAPFMDTRVRAEQCGTAAKLLPVAEESLFIKFEMQVGELHGTWTLIVPLLVSNALTQKVEEELSEAISDQSEQNRRRLKERLLDSRFALELFLPPSAVSVRKLTHLKPGQVIVLKPRSGDPIQVKIAGVNLFQASPVSCGTHRGAQIRRALSVVGSEDKEAG